jgi:hypothetical protein
LLGNFLAYEKVLRRLFGDCVWMTNNSRVARLRSPRSVKRSSSVSTLAATSSTSRARLDRSPKYLATDRTDCVTLENSGGLASYVELLSCLEIMRDARTIQNADPLESDLDPPPAPASRHGSKRSDGEFVKDALHGVSQVMVGA